MSGVKRMDVNLLVNRQEDAGRAPPYNTFQRAEPPKGNWISKEKGSTPNQPVLNNRDKTGASSKNLPFKFTPSVAPPPFPKNFKKEPPPPPISPVLSVEAQFLQKVERVLPKFAAFFGQLQSYEIKETYHKNCAAKSPSPAPPSPGPPGKQVIDLTEEDKKVLKPFVPKFKKIKLPRKGKRKNNPLRKQKPHDCVAFSKKNPSLYKNDFECSDQTGTLQEINIETQLPTVSTDSTEEPNLEENPTKKLRNLRDGNFEEVEGSLPGDTRAKSDESDERVRLEESIKSADEINAHKLDFVEKKSVNKNRSDDDDDDDEDVDFVGGFVFLGEAEKSYNSDADSSALSDDPIPLHDGFTSHILNRDFEHRKRRTSRSSESKEAAHRKRGMGFVNKVSQALSVLGGRATGNQIVQWLIENYKEMCNGDRKTVAYRVNAVLSSKKNAHLFSKTRIRDENKKKTSLWSLTEANFHFVQSSTEPVAELLITSSSSEDAGLSLSEDESVDTNEEMERVQSEDKSLVTAPTQENEELVVQQNVVVPQLSMGCQVCGRADDEHKILLCDGCDDEYHMSCLSPPLLKVPRGKWFCKKCQSQQPPAQDPPDNLSDLQRIEKALKEFGGSGTGVEITSWIAERYNVPLAARKTLAYRVNALLSVNTQLFRKTVTLMEGYHRSSVWELVNKKQLEKQEIEDESKPESIAHPVAPSTEKQEKDTASEEGKSEKEDVLARKTDVAEKEPSKMVLCVISALDALDGEGTTDQIAEWIHENEVEGCPGIAGSDVKSIKFKIAPILSSKNYSHLFGKSNVKSDGLTIWTLKKHSDPKSDALRKNLDDARNLSKPKPRNKETLTLESGKAADNEDTDTESRDAEWQESEEGVTRKRKREGRKSSEAAIRSIRGKKRSRDPAFVDRVWEALNSLRSFSTAEEICTWLVNNSEVEEDFKTMENKLIGVLSSKSYSDWIERSQQQRGNMLVNVYRLRDQLLLSEEINPPKPNDASVTELKLQTDTSSSLQDDPVVDLNNSTAETEQPKPQLETQMIKEKDSDVPSDHAQLSEVQSQSENQNEMPNKFCAICSANASGGQRVKYPQNMTTFFLETQNFDHSLTDSDWLCKVCYDDWAIENKEKMEKKVRARKIPEKELKALAERWDQYVVHPPPDDTPKDKPRKQKRKKDDISTPVPTEEVAIDCTNCGKGSDDANLLLCDSCDRGFHIYCLKPPLKDIPSGDWYCASCQSKKSKLVKGKSNRNKTPTPAI